KGGIVLAIRSSLGIPVKLIGVGEGPEDLQSFSGRDFVNAMFEE
ncbi:MAG: signal recognition particle-docking protein FtsY, partial [Clostridia bacterium]|nr:signal recognition particle-docking protein FtsY [Clostridia bacterium]